MLPNELIGRSSPNPEDITVTSSFQAEDMIVLHIVRQTLPDVPVIFLDTGYHFAEVYEYRDRMARDWSLNLINLLPELTVAEQEAQFGILNQTEPSRCCGMRKVKPLFAALEHYELWFTGMRREQAKSRAAMQLTEYFRAAHRQEHPQDQPAQPTGPRKTSGTTPDSTTFLCSRSTTRATQASAASPAPACPSTPMTPAPDAGAVRSRSAASTSSLLQSIRQRQQHEKELVDTMDFRHRISHRRCSSRSPASAPASVTAPLLILFLHVPVEIAVSTALAYSAIVKLIVVPVQVIRKQINYRVLGIMLLGGLPGVIFGSILFKHVATHGPKAALYFALGFIIVFTSGWHLVPPLPALRHHRATATARSKWLAAIMLPIGAEIGFSSAGAGALGTYLCSALPL